MNIARLNQDLRIAQREAGSPRWGKRPGWRRVDWKKKEPYGGVDIFLREFVLPPNCSAERTDLKIEAPQNFGEPAGNGLLFFYQNFWISPGIRIRDLRSGRWQPMPRLSTADGAGWAYLCLHAGAARPDWNVLHFLRTFELFLRNPGFRAQGDPL